MGLQENIAGTFFANDRALHPYSTESKKKISQHSALENHSMKMIINIYPHKDVFCTAAFDEHEGCFSHIHMLQKFRTLSRSYTDFKRILFYTIYILSTLFIKPVIRRIQPSGFEQLFFGITRNSTLSHVVFYSKDNHFSFLSSFVTSLCRY